MAHPTHISQPGLQMLLINGQQHIGHKEPHHIVKRSSCSNDKDKEKAKNECAGLCDCNLSSKKN
uniref:Ovule protein n=1 Tax=Meloidogyne hapla TaxID=6305 RepID=A0A1I8BU33_MELHA